MSQTYLKIMDDDGYADTHSAKGFRLIPLDAGDVVEYSPNDPLSYALKVTRACHAGEDKPLVFFPEGNVYIMNSEGKSIASYGTCRHRPKQGSGDDTLTMADIEKLSHMSQSKRANFMANRKNRSFEQRPSAVPTLNPKGRIEVVVDTNPPITYVTSGVQAGSATHTPVATLDANKLTVAPEPIWNTTEGMARHKAAKAAQEETNLNYGLLMAQREAEAEAKDMQTSMSRLRDGFKEDWEKSPDNLINNPESLAKAVDVGVFDEPDQGSPLRVR